ncbi:hypothetical protein [Mycobacterium sp. AT1]|nr:hypothetical protein [Mycobacterium sp. AT1]
MAAFGYRICGLRLGRPVVHRRDEVLRWISQRENATDAEVAAPLEMPT